MYKMHAKIKNKSQNNFNMIWLIYYSYIYDQKMEKKILLPHNHVKKKSMPKNLSYMHWFIKNYLQILEELS